jgi:phenylalanyl-tRNA synthetase beta subunit
MRFERGISPELTVPALRRATQLILQIAGGKAARGIADSYPGKKEAKTIQLRTSSVRRLLGLELSQEQIVNTLTSLGFQCTEANSAEAAVTVPYWRMDVNESADLAEEVARIKSQFLTDFQEPSCIVRKPVVTQNILSNFCSQFLPQFIGLQTHWTPPRRPECGNQ